MGNAQIDTFVTDLLHIDDLKKNKMIDLRAGDASTSYYLTSTESEWETSARMLDIIRTHIGKVGNTVLKGSAESEEQIVGRHVNAFAWQAADGSHDPKSLDKFIREVYKTLSYKGNNPLFLSVGALIWKVANTKGEAITVESPYFIFPIRLVRTSKTTPVSIEFIDDAIYINPCLIAKLRQTLGEGFPDDFPHPNGGTGNSELPVSLEALGNGEKYFDALEALIARHGQVSDDTVFRFDRNKVAIAQYNHNEICMYYDIKRHGNAVYENPLIRRVFMKEKIPFETSKAYALPSTVLPTDSVQFKIIERALSGESFVIKGPPGTGKTLTIVNMICALMMEGKRVLMASEKLAALSEVYKKMPKELRDFVMLLDCETEDQAAKLSPNVVKRDFSALIDVVRNEPRLPQSVRDDSNHAWGIKSTAIRRIEEYFTENFSGEDIIGHSYYDALDIFAKYDGIAPHDIANPMHALACNREIYNAFLTRVSRAAKAYHDLTAGEKHPIRLSPWYAPSHLLSLKEDALSAADAAAQIAEKLAREGKALYTLADLYRLVPNDSPLFSLDVAYDLCVERGSAEALAATRNEKATKELVLLYNTLLSTKNQDTLEYIIFHNIDELEADLDLFEILTLPRTLTKDTLLLLQNEREALVPMISKEKFESLKNLIPRVRLEEKEFTASDAIIRAAMRSDLGEKDIKKLEALVEKFAVYDAPAPKLFDKGAAKSFLSYLASPTATFADVLDFSKEYQHMLASKAKMDESLRLITLQLGKTNDFMRAIDAAEILLSYPEEVEQILSAIENEAPMLMGVFNRVTLTQTLTVEKLFEAFETAKLYYSLHDLLAKLYQKDGEEPKKRPNRLSQKERRKMLSAAKSHVSFRLFDTSLPYMSDNDKVEILERLYDNAGELIEDIEAFYDAMKSFGQNHFVNYYVTNTSALTFDELEIYASEARNRNLVSAADQFVRNTADVKMENGTELISIARLFRPYEEGKYQRGDRTFEEIFEHEMFRLALEAKKKMLKTRNGRGRMLEEQLRNLAAADKAIEESNVKLIRDSMIARINPSDPDFAFLSASRDTINNLRRIFKIHGEAIMKLKRCFLLSPSTVSVLFTTDTFSKFDVVIVDEASQLEPTSAIPLLLRTKQCLFVGDEWQMPPIQHFGKGSEHAMVGEDGEMVFLPPDTSLLGLALANEQFKTAELRCHYRSETEALIAYSQHRYYPYMNTFPTPIPKAFGLGFTDCYVPNGYSDGGENIEEAKVAVEKLREHFKYYYDPDTGILSESVGMVAYGTSQLKCIESVYKKDTELVKMVERALGNFKDLPEKLIFFKTVESVQGQEIDHMILSLAYGKNKNGKIIEAFGDLNRGIGECILNVAVTRARKSITVIHSILHTEIENPLIKEYLEYVARFSEGGKSQFVEHGDHAKLGFVRSVVDFIIKQGHISEDRIAIDCGATEGSIRIPLAILNEDRNEANLAIFCEMPILGERYTDFMGKYIDILKGRGWNIYRIFAHDWIDNAVAERQELLSVLRRFVAPDSPDKKGKGGALTDEAPLVSDTVSPTEETDTDNTDPLDDILTNDTPADPEQIENEQGGDSIDDILFESDPKRVDDDILPELN